MSRLDDLPPDQRAVLLLLVHQGKSQAEIADMLGIPQRTVRDRARAALEAIATGPGSDNQGQARAAGGIRSSAPPPSSSSPEPGPVGLAPQTPATFSSALFSSRRGGALLLAALIVIVVVAVILITDGGSSSHRTSSDQTGSTPSTTPSASRTKRAAARSGKPILDRQIALTSPSEPESKTVGLVEVLSEGSRRTLYMAAEHLPPSTGFLYAVWLYKSSRSSVELGRIPSVGSNGQAQGRARLPANARDYHKILLTRETDNSASQPGPVVLSGAFSLVRH